MHLPTLKVGTRLGLGFGLLLLLLGAITVIGIVYIAQIEQRLEQVTRVNNAETRLVLEMRSTLSDRLISLRNLALSNEAALGQAETARIREQAGRYAAAEQTLRRMLASRPLASAGKAALLAKVGEQERAALPLMDKAAALALSLKVDEAARVLMSDLQPLQLRWRAALGELLALEERLNEAEAADAAAASRQARLFLLLLGALSLLVGVATALRISAGLLRQLGGEPADAAAIAGQIAAGKLDVAIELKAGDQASLLFALRSMRDRLAAIVGEVHAGTNHIAAASAQIASGNLDLSARTEQQAGALQQSTASMEELTATVRQNAEHARQADQLALSTADAASGGAAIGGVVASVRRVSGIMSEITSASAEQSRDIEQVHKAISALDRVTQQNWTLVEDAATAAQSLQQRGGRLVAMVSVFKLAAAPARQPSIQSRPIATL